MNAELDPDNTMLNQPPPPPPRASFEPVALSQRVTSVDTLRGFALLGILVMNIIAFAYPSMAYMNPDLESLRPYAGEFAGANKAVWWMAHTFFDMKMMSIFSMLFGAGLVLMNERSTSKYSGVAGGDRTSFSGVYYRRLMWLFLIGMIHAYLIWWGDILVAYALCGLLLYPLRRMKPVWLIVIGSIVAMVAVVIGLGFGGAMEYVRTQAIEAQRILDAGGTPTDAQRSMLNSSAEMMKGMNPPAEDMSKAITNMRGSIGEVLAAR